MSRLVNLKTGEITVLNKPVFRIGRERSYVDYYIPDPSVSRIHCQLLCNETGWYLTDSFSTNRSYVNGIEIPPNTPVFVKNGDEIMLANVRLRFEEVR